MMLSKSNNRQEFILPQVSSPTGSTSLSLSDVRAAAARIAGSVHRTPLLSSTALSERLGWWYYRDPADPIRLIDGLRKAGLPT